MTRAITLVPGQAGTVRLDELDGPSGEGDLLVEALALGVCGTDREIAEGAYGWSPEGRDRLVLGHESLGRVKSAPSGSGFSEGDLVVGVVRRPDPQPCACCAQGQFDMCRNGDYTERGIKSRDGYGAEEWRVEPEYALKLDAALEKVGVLCEPTTIVAKAWERIDELAHRACAAPHKAVVTGAGPVGLLAAMLAVQRGLETWVVDIVGEGLKPELVRDLGAHYHCGSITELDVRPDTVVEATGVAQVIVDSIKCTRPDGVVCLAGVSPTGKQLSVDMGELNNDLVLGNRTVFGSVNANLGHYKAAAEALARADAGWLERLITRRVGLSDWESALERRDGDVKVVVDFTA